MIPGPNRERLLPTFPTLTSPSSYILLILFKRHKRTEIYSVLLKEPVSLVYVCELSLQLLHPHLDLILLLQPRLQQTLLSLQLCLSDRQMSAVS